MIHGCRSKKWHYWFELWKANVWLLCPASNKTLNDFIRWQFRAECGEDEKASLGGKAVDITHDGGWSVVIAVNTFDGTPEAISRLAHECFHATEYIMHRAGIRHCDDTSEAFAYTMDCILRVCLRDLMRVRHRYALGQFDRIDPVCEDGPPKRKKR